MKKIRFLLAVFCMTFTYLNAQDINKVIHINFDNTPLREAFYLFQLFCKKRNVHITEGKKNQNC